MTARDLDAVVDVPAGKYGLSAAEANVVRVAFHHLRATPEDVAAVLGPQPAVYAHDDGTTRIEWPEGVTSCVMSREALDGYAENVNGAWRALTEARRDLESMRRMIDRRGEVTS